MRGQSTARRGASSPHRLGHAHACLVLGHPVDAAGREVVRRLSRG